MNFLDNETYNFVRKVVDSCETTEQASSVMMWIIKCPFISNQEDLLLQYHEKESLRKSALHKYEQLIFNKLEDK